MKKKRKRRISVSLSESDWLDLAQFLTGDIHNMEEGCPVKSQMRRIVGTIQNRIARNPTPTQPDGEVKSE